MVDALADLPPDLTVVLVARETGPKARAPKGLAKAVEAAGGEVLTYAAPKARDLPARLIEEAARRGFRLEAAAARLLVERMGEGTLRLMNELDRLALWAGPNGEVEAADLEAMVADTSEEAAWTLSDSIVARDPAGAVAAAERLVDQGEAITPLVYQAARRLRDANAALVALEAGVPRKKVESRRSPCTPMRRGCWSGGSGRLRLGRPRRHLRDRRSRVVDPRRLGVCGRRGFDPRRAAGGRRRRGCGLSGPSRRRREPARAAPATRRNGSEAGRRETSCGRRCWDAARPSGPPCRFARRARDARRRSSPARPSPGPARAA